jgi:hypothetical protein
MRIAPCIQCVPKCRYLTPRSSLTAIICFVVRLAFLARGNGNYRV